MLNYVNRMPDDERRKYETDMMERLDCAPDFILQIILQYYKKININNLIFGFKKINIT